MRFRSSLLAASFLFLLTSIRRAGRRQGRAAQLFALHHAYLCSGESVKIQLYAKNVPALEFRVYKVRDPRSSLPG